MPRRKKELLKGYRKTTPLLIVVFSLLLMGIFAIYNSTIFYSQSIYGSPYRFMFLHLGWVIVGMVGFFIFYTFHYKTWIRYSSFLFVITLVVLFILSFFGFFTFQVGLIECSASRAFVPCINGAYRWLHINSAPLPEIPFLGVLSLQPSELAKLTTIIFVSALLSKRISSAKILDKNIFISFIIPVGLVFVMVLLQPNMSTATLILLISFAIYFCSGASLKPFYLLVPVILVLFLVLMLASPYRRQRFMTLVMGGDSGNTALSSGYHTRQVLISLGSGGVFGVGIGQSRQKYQYLPEVASDSIFAIIGEELGFFGTVSLVLLYSFLIYQGFNIASSAPDMFSKSVAVGVTSWMGLQFFVNVASMVQLIPLTGVPIPLISYGGSSLFFVMCGLGLLANVSKYCD